MEEKYNLIKSIEREIEDCKRHRDVYNFFNPNHQPQYRYWDGQVDALNKCLYIIQHG